MASKLSDISTQKTPVAGTERLYVADGTTSKYITTNEFAYKDANNDILSQINELDLGNDYAKNLKAFQMLAETKYHGIKGHQVVAGVIRRVSGTWTILDDKDDLNHQPLSVSYISGTTRPTIHYACAMTMTHAFIINPDEDMARWGYNAGASVSNHDAQFDIFRSVSMRAIANYNGSSWDLDVMNSDTELDITSVAWNGTNDELDVTFPELTDAIVMVNSNVGGTQAVHVRSRQTSTGCSIAFYDSSGTKLTTESTNMDISITISFHGQITTTDQLSDIDNQGSGNFWFIGIFANEERHTQTTDGIFCDLDIAQASADGSSVIHDKSGYHPCTVYSEASGRRITFESVGGEESIKFNPSDNDKMYNTLPSMFYNDGQERTYYLRLQLDDVTSRDIFGYWRTTDNNRSHLLQVSGSSVFQWNCSSDGTSTTHKVVNSTVSLSTATVYDVVVKVSATTVSIAVGTKGGALETPVEDATYSAPADAPYYPPDEDNENATHFNFGGRLPNTSSSTSFDGNLIRFVAYKGIASDADIATWRA